LRLFARRRHLGHQVTRFVLSIHDTWGFVASLYGGLSWELSSLIRFLLSQLSSLSPFFSLWCLFSLPLSGSLTKYDAGQKQIHLLRSTSGSGFRACRRSYGHCRSVSVSPTNWISIILGCGGDQAGPDWLQVAAGHRLGID
jgi:hypothetical protein